MATSAQPRGGRVGHTGAESPSGRGAHGSIHGVGHTWPLGHLRPRALLRIFSPYLEHPTSDFESVFGLRTVTPSHMIKTIQL